MWYLQISPGKVYILPVYNGLNSLFLLYIINCTQYNTVGLNEGLPQEGVVTPVSLVCVNNFGDRHRQTFKDAVLFWHSSGRDHL